ncbi:MAG: pyridoxal phosphate-dependent class II aminotransferase [Lachnospiraceae bacterium]|nr:pyridoxal phosphate-dependent class II aminotransferase [Lachnospiraceae bacterium]
MQTQIHGGDIYTNTYRIDFSANINPLGTPQAVLDAACAGVLQAPNYPDVQCRELKRAIAGKEAVPPEWVICGNGAAELIFTLAAALHPRKALLCAPGFAEYEQALNAAGCSCRFYECKESEQFRLGEDYLDWITEDLDVIFLCNPNNPTGLLLDPELMKRILMRCRAKRVRLVLDECFNELLQNPEAASMIPYLSEFPELFILKAFTKLYAMAGLRLGYGLCAEAALLEKMSSVVQPWNVSIPAQMAGTAALKEEEYVLRSRAYIGAERQYLKQGLQKLGLEPLDSQANFIFFQGPEDLYDRCAQKGILIRDCGNYRGLTRGYYRIAVRTREENEELLSVMRQVL